MLHAVLPMVLLQLRCQPNGKEALDSTKFVSKYVSRQGALAEAHYEANMRFVQLELHNLITSTTPACIRTLQSLAKEFEYEMRIQHSILFSIIQCVTEKHGERWKQLGPHFPQNICNVRNAGLGAALGAGKRTFTAAELELLGVGFLEQTACVKFNNMVYEVDQSQIDPTKDMAPVEVFHTIILRTMQEYGTYASMTAMNLFLLKCFHQPLWRSTFKEGTYRVHATRALRLVGVAMRHFAADHEIQKTALKATVHLCAGLRLNAIFGRHHYRRHVVMEPVLAAMRRFPDSMDVQFNCIILIIATKNATSVARALDFQLAQRRSEMFKGIGMALVTFCTEHLNPELTILTCGALLALFETEIANTVEMQAYISFFVWVFRKWDEVSEDHFCVRDSAITALNYYFEARDKPPFTDLQKAQHRDVMRNMINQHDMNRDKAGVPEKEWLGHRLLSYMCPYSTIPLIRIDTNRLCDTMLLLREMCQDNNRSRKLFIYESNGIHICLSIAKYFVEKGLEHQSDFAEMDHNMDVAAHAVAVVETLYTQIYTDVETKVAPEILQTASAACFVSSPVHDIAVLRYPPTAGALSSKPLMSMHQGVTVISFLQDILRVVGITPILIESCVITLEAVMLAPGNAHGIDIALISRYATCGPELPKERHHKIASRIVAHCLGI